MSVKPEFEQMSGPELVKAFNDMVAAAVAKGLEYRPVAKFADRTVGIKRCEMIASSLRAAASAFKEETPAKPEPAQPSAGEERTATTVPGRTEEMATKSAAKKAPAKNGAAVAKAPKAKLDGLPGEFGCRAGTHRETLIKVLEASKKTQVPFKTIIKKMYGSDADIEEMKGPAAMVIKGAEKMISDNSLPYEIRREKDEKKEVSYGLYPAGK